MGPDQIGDALKGCEVVVIPAGVPRKPGGCTFYILLADGQHVLNVGCLKGLDDISQTKNEFGVCYYILIKNQR